VLADKMHSPDQEMRIRTKTYLASKVLYYYNLAYLQKFLSFEANRAILQHAVLKMTERSKRAQLTTACLEMTLKNLAKVTSPASENDEQ